MRKWLLSLLFVPIVASAQKQYFLPTDDPTVDEKEKPMIEVYLPKQEIANGCAVLLCPGGAMRWLSWESDVIKMASFLNEHGIAAIGLRYHLNKAPMPQGMKMPPMVDVTHPEAFPKAPSRRRPAGIPRYRPRSSRCFWTSSCRPNPGSGIPGSPSWQWHGSKSGCCPPSGSGPP